MKKIILLFILFSNSFLIAQNLDSIARAEKLIYKDSVYSNRFNKGNFQIGGIPLYIIGRGDLSTTELDGYGLHSEFGYFIKNRLLLLTENTSLYYNYNIKNLDHRKQYYFYSMTSAGLRYYINSKRFTFFAQTFINYSYNSEDLELIYGLTPTNLSRLDIMPGIGTSFCFNLFDVSLEFNYAIPFMYSKEINTDRLSYWGNIGLLPMLSLYFTF